MELLRLMLSGSYCSPSDDRRLLFPSIDLLLLLPRSCDCDRLRLSLLLKWRSSEPSSSSLFSSPSLCKFLRLSPTYSLLSVVLSLCTVLEDGRVCWLKPNSSSSSSRSKASGSWDWVYSKDYVRCELKFLYRWSMNFSILFSMKLLRVVVLRSKDCCIALTIDENSA